MIRAPRVTKGAFINGNPAKPTTRIPFQFNPTSIIRRVHADGDSVHETVEFTLVIDDSDRLETPDEKAQSVANRLSQLELLLCTLAPTTLSLGARLLPVRITSLLITEELFSADLQPIRASVVTTVEGTESLPTRRERLTGSLQRHG